MLPKDEDPPWDCPTFDSEETDPAFPTADAPAVALWAVPARSPGATGDAIVGNVGIAGSDARAVIGAIDVIIGPN